MYAVGLPSCYLCAGARSSTKEGRQTLVGAMRLIDKIWSASVVSGGKERGVRPVSLLIKTFEDRSVTPSDSVNLIITRMGSKRNPTLHPTRNEQPNDLESDWVGRDGRGRARFGLRLQRVHFSPWPAWLCTTWLTPANKLASELGKMAAVQPSEYSPLCQSNISESKVVSVTEKFKYDPGVGTPTLRTTTDLLNHVQTSEGITPHGDCRRDRATLQYDIGPDTSSPRAHDFPQ